jgi:hypothetical protein
MDPQRLGQTTVVAAIADPDLLDQVLSVTAVVGVEPLVVSDPALLRPHWASASMLLLGVDQADRVAAMGLPRRAEVYLVAGEQTPAAQDNSGRYGSGRRWCRCQRVQVGCPKPSPISAEQVV